MVTAPQSPPDSGRPTNMTEGAVNGTQEGNSPISSPATNFPTGHTGFDEAKEDELLGDQVVGEAKEDELYLMGN